MTETKELTTKEKARLMKNAYQREWAKKNPDKVTASMERHYAKKYDQMIEQMIEDFKQDHEISDERVDDDLLKAIARSYIVHDLEPERIGDAGE